MKKILILLGLIAPLPLAGLLGMLAGNLSTYFSSSLWWVYILVGVMALWFLFRVFANKFFPDNVGVHNANKDFYVKKETVCVSSIKTISPPQTPISVILGNVFTYRGQCDRCHGVYELKSGEPNTKEHKQSIVHGFCPYCRRTSYGELIYVWIGEVEERRRLGLPSVIRR